MRTILSSLAIGAMMLPSVVTKAEIINVFVTPGEALVATIHAEGAQVYECKADAAGQLAWKFREPVATLMIDGKTVGRHFAGPSWELSDGSLVTGKVSGSAPGATVADIPHLRLEVASQRGARPAQPRHHDPSTQHQGRARPGVLRQGRRLPQRALLGGLPVLQADR